MTAIVAPLLGALSGAIAGSFLATVAVRDERGESAIRGRSRCDSCSVALGWRDLVPLASFVALRGRCRVCRAPIDRRHPLIELACLAIGLGAIAARDGLAGWAGALFGWLLVTLAVIDATSFRLPDRLTLPLLALGLGAGAAGIAPPVIARALGAAGGYAALTLIALAYRLLRGRDGLGRGDPKLLAAIGAWLGWRPLPLVVFAAALAGLGWVVALRLSGRRVAGADRLPLGTLLALAAWPAWLWGA